MVEIVGLGFWVVGHGNRFVDRSLRLCVLRRLSRRIASRPRGRTSPRCYSRDCFMTTRKNQSSLVATHAVSSHSACTGVGVDRELVRRYSDLSAQNRLEALELQRRVNEHASNLLMSVWV
nr:hypothetical protein CFP56_76720 [Quercus suber]